jgi:hypothetical protein
MTARSMVFLWIGAVLVVVSACSDGGGGYGLGDAGTDTDTDADTDGDTDGDTDTDTDADTDTDTDADTDTDTDTDTDADTDADTDGDADMDSGISCTDNDSDGWCLPFDCNDATNLVYPSAVDWETDGVDNDCDGTTDEGVPDASVTCGEDTLDFDIPHIKLMVLLDYSGSMDSGTPNKWTSAKTALNAVLTGDLADGFVDFGFEYFPINTGCDLHSTVFMDTQPGATYAASIATAINGMSAPNGANLTPLYYAVQKFTTSTYAPIFLDLVTNPNAYLVLVGDGQNHSSCSTHTAAQLGTLVANMHTDGVTTIMVGFSVDATYETTLNAVGLNGGYSPYPAASSGDYYFTAEDSTTFETALEEIVSNIVPCTYPVDTTGPDINPDEVNFYFDGVVVPYNPDCSTMPPGPDVGWMWTSPAQDEVEFCTSTCQELKDGDVEDITATFGCPSIVG